MRGKAPGDGWRAGRQCWVCRAAMQSCWHSPKPTCASPPASSSGLIIYSKDHHELQSASWQIIRDISDTR